MVQITESPARRTVRHEAMGERIRRLRLARGWTQWETAEHAGLTHADIVGRAERGCDVFASTLAGLAQAFDVTLDELWNGRES